MARTRRRRFGLRLVVLAGTLGILVGVLPAAPALAATDKLPDLKVAKMADFSIQRTASGRRLLRFSGMMLNVGRGPFEIRGRRASTKKPWIIDQIVYRTGGTKRRVPTTATMKYAGDGHNHWHVRRMLSYHLWSTHGTSRDAKIGFCFFDTNRRNTTLPGAPKFRKYQQSGCGKRGSLHTTNGISVGWGDLYPAKFAYQWIDITGLPAGTYTIRASVDLYGKFLESNEANNCTWAKVSFKATGKKVKVVSTGSKCLNDHDTTPYAPDIDWAAEQRIAGNCDADMFCTYDPITRAQLASYLARALDLPPSDTDFFTDDNGNAREADINRAAAAGLFAGCAANKFCPSGTITRGSMATVLVRAMAAPPTETDYFTDDETNGHEADINAAAEARLMPGCTATTFCPARKVTRGATMQLLHAIFGAEPPPDDPPPPADEASIDGAFTDADPGGEATLAVSRSTGNGAASDGALASWVAPTEGGRVASGALMECPIVRTDEAETG
jgi:hypothetical protein